MNSSLIDALEQIDRNNAQHFMDNVTISGIQLANSSENECTDVEIVNDHDYVISASGDSKLTSMITPTGKPEDNSQDSRPTLSERVPPTHSDTQDACSKTKDPFNLSDSSDNSDVTPAKEDRININNIRGKGHGQGRGQGRGQCRGQGSRRGQKRNIGKGEVNIQQDLGDGATNHSSQENSQELEDLKEPIQTTPIKQNVALSVVKLSSPDGKSKVRIHIKPNTLHNLPAPCKTESQVCSPSFGCRQWKYVTPTPVKRTPEISEVSVKAERSQPDIGNGPNSNAENLSAMLCPHCGTWSSTLDKCSSCTVDFIKHLPKKCRDRNGHVGSFIPPVTSRPSYRTETSVPLTSAVQTQTKVADSIIYVLTPTKASPTSSLGSQSNPLIFSNRSALVTVKGQVSTNAFYAGKPRSPSFMSTLGKVMNLNKNKKPACKPAARKKRSTSMKKTEPEVISIDSDSEEDISKGSNSAPTKTETTPSLNADRLSDTDQEMKQLSRKFRMRNQSGEIVEDSPQPKTVAVKCEDKDDEEVTSTEGTVVLPTIMLRFGSLGICNPLPVEFNKDRFLFHLPDIYCKSPITLDTKSLEFCQYSFSYGMPTIVMVTTPHFASVVRERLRMTKGQAFYDPGSRVEAERHIVFRPIQEKLPSDVTSSFESMFQEISLKKGILKDKLFVKLTKITIGVLLGKCKPLQDHLDEEYLERTAAQQKISSTMTISKEDSIESRVASTCTSGNKTKSELGSNATICEASTLSEEKGRTLVTRSKSLSEDAKGCDGDKNTPTSKCQPEVILVYPSAPIKGGIAVHKVDIECLSKGEFLNDVIIDFYIKYLLYDVIGEAAREKTFVFSSFFYGRLMRREYSRDGHGADSNMSRMEKRHQKVRTWTRHVDIFQKDFVIIPINEHCHWYVAVICFPGLAAEPECMKTTLTSPGLIPLESAKITRCDEDAHNHSTPMTPVDNKGTSLETNLNESPHLPATSDSSSEMDESMDIGENALSSRQGTEDDESMETDAAKPSPLRTDRTMEPRVDSTDSSSEHSSNSCPQSDAEDAVYAQYQKVHCRRPCILIFDSLGGPSRRNVIQNIKEYLIVEWQTRKKSQLVYDAKVIKGCQPRVPQQNNFSDCGVFLLQYVQMFFQKPIINFSMPIKGLERWFTEATISKKRNEIRDLIYELKMRHNANKR